MTQYDAPNQQVVRPDGSGPAEEGEGGQVQATRQDADQEEEGRQEGKGKGGRRKGSDSKG